MPIYLVLGRDAAGKSRTAKIQADSVEHARQRAIKHGVTPETVAIDTSDPSMTEPRVETPAPAATPNVAAAPPVVAPVFVPPPAPPAPPVTTIVSVAPNRPAVEAERVLYVAKGTFIPTISALVVLGIFALITGACVLAGATPLAIVFGVLASIAALRALWVYLVWNSTTLTITNRRVFGRQGVISTTDISLLHDKVESFSVRQGLSAKIWGYGDILIAGSGQGRVIFGEIDKPMVVRRSLEEAVEATRNARQAAPQIVYVQAPMAAAAT